MSFGRSGQFWKGDSSGESVPGSRGGSGSQFSEVETSGIHRDVEQVGNDEVKRHVRGVPLTVRFCNGPLSAVPIASFDCG